jgi:ribulose 1,5-bisphosphate carboxylase large subunit-like protein
MQVENVKSSADFFKEIEKMVKEKNIEYFEAVLLYCEKNDIEVETIASVVKQNSALKSKIQIEAENLKMLKKSSARLPI